MGEAPGPQELIVQDVFPSGKQMLDQSIRDPFRTRSLTQHAAIDIQQLLHQAHQSLFMPKFNYLANRTTAQLKPYRKTPETNSARNKPPRIPNQIAGTANKIT